MKKGLVLALVVSFVLSMAGTALAFPVDFNGDFRLQARSIDDKINASAPAAYKRNFAEFRARINFTGQVDKDTAFFGRFSVRNYESLGAEVRSNNEFDQFGVKLTTGDWKLSIGRQALTVGAGSLLDIGSDAAGATNFFDGVVASAKTGDVDVRVFGGKNTSNIYPFTSAQNPSNEWYGVELGIKPDKSLSAGAAYVHKKSPVGGIDGVNYWAINAAFNATDSLVLNTEYAKSNAATLNSGYFFAGTYSWDKDSFTVQYNRVKDNAVDIWNGGIAAGPYPFKGKDLPAGYKGFTYAYSHGINKNLSFHAIYMDLKALNPADGTGSDKELAAGLVWKF